MPATGVELVEVRTFRDGDVREQLAELSGLDKATLEIERDPRGKPRLASHPEIGFSLSHSRGLSALALVEGRDVGIDLEWIRPLRHGPAIARRVFDEREAARLAELPLEAFFEAWTLHEARVKAAGLSVFDTPPPFEARSLELAPGYAAAVAVTG